MRYNTVDFTGGFKVTDILTQIKNAMQEATKPGVGALKRLDQLETILESWMKNTNSSIENLQNQVDFLMPNKVKDATYKLPDEEFIMEYITPTVNKISRSHQKREEYKKLIAKIIRDAILEFNRDLSIEDFPEVSIGSRVRFLTNSGSPVEGQIVGTRKYAFEINVGDTTPKILRTKYIVSYEILN